jgi:hypothetical protein
MSEQPMTVTEMARIGGRARAERHSKAEIRRWGKQGGRPARLGARALSRLARMLAQGKSQAECARVFGVSVRTIGRAVARTRSDEKGKGQTR